jgi:hypothetical protein
LIALAIEVASVMPIQIGKVTLPVSSLSTTMGAWVVGSITNPPTNISIAASCTMVENPIQPGLLSRGHNSIPLEEGKGHGKF